MIKLLFLGDIVGEGGRLALKKYLPLLRTQHSPDLVIANGENAAGGLGLVPKNADEIFSYGVDVITSGNHIWKHREIKEYLDAENSKILRPYNYPDHQKYYLAGSGFYEVKLQNFQKSVIILNLMGRVFMDHIDCPFKAAEKFLSTVDVKDKIVFVDFHAETTSEKIAMGWFLDGKVNALIGTHTHVQTADERVLPQGTAYITDAGMCGCMDTVIGVQKEIIIERLITSRPIKFEFPKDQNIGVNGVLVQIDENNFKNVSIQRISHRDKQ